MEERIQLVLRTLPAAGKIYLQYADSKNDLLIQEKKSNDFVTQADKEIETLFTLIGRKLYRYVSYVMDRFFSQF